MEILYLCDRKACKTCHPDYCTYTTSIEHAVNFERHEYGGYLEKDTKPLLIMKTDRCLKKEDIDRIRDNIKAQIKEGLVLVDRSIAELILVCKNGYGSIEEGKNVESERTRT